MAGKQFQQQKPLQTITLVGAGNLAHTLGASLWPAGYTIDAVIAKDTRASMSRAKRLAKEIGSQARSFQDTPTGADVIWLCVPDAEISRVAQLLAKHDGDWTGKIVLHSSGALTSDELLPLQRRGAVVASVHPMMTLVKHSRPSLTGVPFAMEGDPAAVRVARRIVRDLGGQAFSIRKQDKVAYHAWGTFASPLLTALLATGERVAAAAGISATAARRRILPMVTQTIANYASLSAAGAFSGPIVRGDVEVVKRHLGALEAIPEAREVYVALARSAMKYLPGKRRDTMRKALNRS
jgi:predicted short-subunit dehydrogenase-like oxidoreductase (DUF2520 family)